MQELVRQSIAVHAVMATLRRTSCRANGTPTTSGGGRTTVTEHAGRKWLFANRAATRRLATAKDEVSHSDSADFDWEKALYPNFRWLKYEALRSRGAALGA